MGDPTSDRRDCSYSVRDPVGVSIATKSEIWSSVRPVPLRARISMARVVCLGSFHLVWATRWRVTAPCCARAEGTVRSSMGIARQAASRLMDEWPLYGPLPAPEGLGGFLHDLALRTVRGGLDGLLEREPADVLHLVVVSRHVASGGAHEEETDRLAHTHALPDVEVGDLSEVILDLRLQPGLLTDLAQRRVAGILAPFDEPLGQAPGQVALAGPAGGGGQLGAAALVAVDDASCGPFEPGVHRRHTRTSTVAPAARARSSPRS